MKLAARRGDALAGTRDWRGGAPLWQRAPKRDADGRPLADFMMIAPAFKGRSGGELEAALILIEAVLARFEPWVVFADFNLDLNLLWVSHRPRPGLALQIVAALRERLPELRLVAHLPDLPGGL